MPAKLRWIIAIMRTLYFLACAVACLLYGSANAQDTNVLSIAIIAPHDASGNAYLPYGETFQVQISNHSDHPVTLWNDLCERGHWALSFFVQSTNGTNRIVQKRLVPADTWTNFPPQTITIPPRKTYPIKVSLSDFFWGERVWINPPEPNTGEKITFRAIFELKADEQSKKQGAWAGRIESPAILASVVNPKLKSPQDYLWNSCPEQALKMLQEDPSWIHKGDPEYHCTPLHHAARFGYQKVVIWLIGHGADVNAVAYNGFTPLHLTERKDIAELLINAGADLKKQNSFGKTALQFASETGKQDVVDAIVKSGQKLDLYTSLVLKKRDVAIKILIEDPNAIVGGNGGSDLGENTTPLGWAAEKGDLELAELLIEAGAPINDPTECIRYGGTATPLCNAVWAGKTEMVQFLLERGAATDVVGGKFWSSITEYAGKKSDPKIVELLKRYNNNQKVGYASGQNLPLIKNKLPERIASGLSALPIPKR